MVMRVHAWSARSFGGPSPLITEAIEQPADPACAPLRNENVHPSWSRHTTVCVGAVVEEVETRLSITASKPFGFYSRDM